MIRLHGTDIFGDEAVFAMIPLDRNQILTKTRKKNYFFYDGQTCFPFPIPINRFLTDKMIYFGIRYLDHLVFFTRRSRVVFLHLQGNIRRNLNRQSGMIDDAINYTFSGNDFNCGPAHESYYHGFHEIKTFT